MWLRHSRQPRRILDEDVLWSIIPLPLNVNDIDLGSVAGEMPMARDESTEMSFFLINLEVTQLIANLEILDSTSDPAKMEPSIDVRRKNLVECVVTRIERGFLRHCDTSRPLDWFLMLTTKAMLVGHD
jgi:hypothetical protein